jgi:hypothetical protein
LKLTCVLHLPLCWHVMQELHDSVLRNPRTNSSSAEDSTIAIWELSKVKHFSQLLSLHE